MRFLVDNQLPASLARRLRDRGHDAEHVFASGLHLLDDRALWAGALADDRIAVSKDEYFLFLAGQPGDRGRFLWVRLGNCRNDAPVAAFATSVDTIIAAFDSGQIVVELI
jgi:predicted nuclease of predicted toxin-antitoxin system